MIKNKRALYLAGLITEEQMQEMARPTALKTSERSKANSQIHLLTAGFHQRIPLDGIFNALADIGVEVVQEDGTKWDGMLLGNKECGSEGAQNQRVNFDLVRIADRMPLNNSLFLSWCKMPSGSYEVISYVS